VPRHASPRLPPCSPTHPRILVEGRGRNLTAYGIASLTSNKPKNEKGNHMPICDFCNQHCARRHGLTVTIGKAR